MRVLILGSGGREHALALAMAQSPALTHLFAAPGNAGIAEIAQCFDLSVDDPSAVVDWARENAIDLIVVGPEAPLADGVADTAAAAGIAIFGPSAAAARLEASKAFTHEVCAACGAPMADWRRFTEVAPAKAHIEARFLENGVEKIVVKADGLAAGKGVVVAQSAEEACTAVERMLSGDLGAAGAEVVIEEFLPGEEASFFVLSDGETILPLASARDYKRVGEGDTGPNTGGMGAVSPAPAVTSEVEARVMEQIIRPVIGEMAARGTPYLGVLYAGLMIESGEPRLIEFNVRFGDPECQVLMLRLASDLLPILHACATGKLAGKRLDWRAEQAVTVVMAANGYPGSYSKGSAISGLDAAVVPDVTIFHAGTEREGGQILATGGRVLNVSAIGATVQEARDRAYNAIARIEWPEGFCRRDIAQDIVTPPK